MEFCRQYSGTCLFLGSTSAYSVLVSGLHVSTALCTYMSVESNKQRWHVSDVMLHTCIQVVGRHKRDYKSTKSMSATVSCCKLQVFSQQICSEAPRPPCLLNLGRENPWRGHGRNNNQMTSHHTIPCRNTNTQAIRQSFGIVYQSSGSPVAP